MLLNSHDAAALDFDCQLAIANRPGDSRSPTPIFQSIHGHPCENDDDSVEWLGPKELAIANLLDDYKSNKIKKNYKVDRNRASF